MEKERKKKHFLKNGFFVLFFLQTNLASEKV